MVSPSDILRARILIVDDQEDSASTLKEILELSGYKNVSITTAASKVRGLHINNHYHLIVLDLLMPDMDGFEVMRALRTSDPGDYLPVLALTGEPSYKLQALKAGASDFITKPFDVEEVLTRIHHMLEVRLINEEARKTATSMEILALYDPITGLPNRRLLVERTAAAIANARRHLSTMAVLFLDLDGFKEVNDTYGHDAGDRLLKAVGRRLKSVVRQEDTVARIGGDEFVIALWNGGLPSDVEAVSAKLVNSIAQPYTLDDHTVRVTTSLGASLYPFHGNDPEALLKTADQALYDAKRSGKNVFRLAEQSQLS